MTSTKGHRGWGHIRQLPTKTKRHQASFIGPDEKRHKAPTTFTMDAEVWLANERRIMETAKASGSAWVSPAERAAINTVAHETLTEYGKRWIAQRNIKPRTRIHYESIFAAHIEVKLGAMAVANLTAQVVRRWYAETLINRPTMRAHAYGLLNSICKTAVSDELLSRNPCTIEGAASTKRSVAPKILEIDELATVADKIEPARFRALVLISAWCGLRYGEVTELRRNDIAETCEVISVARGATHITAKQAGPDGQRCIVSTPKSGKPRRGRAAAYP